MLTEKSLRENQLLIKALSGLVNWQTQRWQAAKAAPAA